MEKARQYLEQQIIEKAWADEKFRTELIASPNKVIEQFLGQALPQSLHIKIIEETSDRLYLVIPVNPEQLPDAVLDLVAAGAGGSPGSGSINDMSNKA